MSPRDNHSPSEFQRQTFSRRRRLDDQVHSLRREAAQLGALARDGDDRTIELQELRDRVIAVCPAAVDAIDEAADRLADLRDSRTGRRTLVVDAPTISETAANLYAVHAKNGAPAFADLPLETQEFWLAQARTVIPILVRRLVR